MKFLVTLAHKKTKETKSIKISTTSQVDAMEIAKRYVDDPRQWQVLRLTKLPAEVK